MADEVRVRPTGETTQIVGWLFLAISLVLIFAGWASGTQTYGLDYLRGIAANSVVASSAAGSIPRSLEQKLWLAAAGGAFCLFLVFWSVGTLVRAISFLPGREITIAPTGL